MPEVLRATAEHADACARLFMAGTPAAARSVTILGTEGYGRYLAWQIETSTRGGDHHYWVAQSDGVTIGAAEYRQFGGCWFLNNIHIDERVRGQGVGSTLLRHTASIGMSRGCHRLALDVFASNAAARGWYERLGFAVIARTTYVGHAVPAVEQGLHAGTLRNLPQAEVLYAAFGFAMLQVQGAEAYDVGVLGTTWYRVTDHGLLTDAAALAALHAYAPQRRLLLVTHQQGTGEETVPPSSDSVDVLVQSLRMEAAMETVITTP